MPNNTIIDRRKNPGGKSSGNRQKFLKRTKDEIRKSIHEKLGGRSIKGSSDDQDVTINRKGISEPSFGHKSDSGSRDIVLPGNEDFVEGDLLQKPQGGEGGGGSQGSPDGEGEDDFQFALSNDEFVNILFEDLELPHMISKENKVVEKVEMHRSGFTNDGNPAQLNLEKSMINSMGRRIALQKPKMRKIRELEALLETEEDEDKRLELEEEISSLRIRARAVAFIDPVDLRYNNFTTSPKPSSQAVVFFIMDVSASMTEMHKDLAKRFFMMLNLFISRKYKRVDAVFIRHHTQAKECDEEEFFTGRESGGTVVSSAFELAKDIMSERYSPSEWNVYFAQASDGDNWSDDNGKLLEILQNDILPVSQFFSYIEVGEPRGMGMLGGFAHQLMEVYDNIVGSNQNMVAERVQKPSDVYPIFRKIFAKDRKET
jgi:uncharacterized sporulation protein YeaH/YhbH (DUF444 family)